MSKKAAAKDINLTDKAGDVAKSIWLAGLGAYGKAFDEAVNQYGKVSKETSKMFDDRINKVRGSVNLSALNMGGSDAAKIEELNSKIDVLSEKLDALLDSMAVKAKAAKTRSAS